MDQVSLTYNSMVDNYLQAFGLVILFYDHALTFIEEIQYIWAGPKSISSALFLLNRYFGIFGHLINEVLKSQLQSDKSCSALGLSYQLTIVGSQAVVGCLLFLRVYALYGRSVRVLVFWGLTELIMVAITIWSIIERRGTMNFACNFVLSEEDAVYTAVGWEVLILSDVIIFSLTVARSFAARKELQGLKHMRHVSLRVLMFRDGATYFAVMALATLSNILTFYLAPTGLRGSLTTFSTSVSIAMVSRLMLNLHKTARTIMTPGTISDSAFTSKHSQSIRVQADVEAQADIPIRIRAAPTDIVEVGRHMQ